MRKYYEELKKIEDFASFDRTGLLDYIHRQKSEASAVCASAPTPFIVDAAFWVELDYIIGLAKYALTAITEEKKGFFITCILMMKEKLI